MLLRQDMVQMCAADLYGVWQPTVSRIWRRILPPLMDEVLAFADTAYIATTAITPIKKTPGRDRLEWEKTFNHDVSSLRSTIEHIIGHLIS